MWDPGKCTGCDGRHVCGLLLINANGGVHLYASPPVATAQSISVTLLESHPVRNRCNVHIGDDQIIELDGLNIGHVRLEAQVPNTFDRIRS